jgi:hypothetical protein
MAEATTGEQLAELFASQAVRSAGGGAEAGGTDVGAGSDCEFL